MNKEYIPFIAVIEDVTKVARKIEKSNYLVDGKYPIIDQGKNDIAGYAQEREGLFGDVPAIIFGDHTRIIKYVDMPCFIGADGVKLLRVKSTYANDFDYKFLYYYFSYQNIPDTGYNRHFKWLKAINILKLTLETQHQIAATLDKASELISLRKKQLQKLDTLAESVFYDMFGDPVKNEKGWKTQTISSLIDNKPNSLKRGPFGGALKKEIFVNSGCLVYEQYHALNNDYSFARYFITEEKYNELKSFAVNSDDIIISCSGVNLGRLSIVPKKTMKGIINQALLKLSLNQKKMRNNVFVRIFECESFKNKYFGNQRGCAIPNFPPMSDFRKFEFPLPPIELQNKFVDIIEKIEQQKNLAKKALQESEDLFQRLMQDLFRIE